MAPTKASDINWQGTDVAAESIEDREFRDLGDSKYVLDIRPMGIKLEVDRLRRDREGLVGELCVSVGPKFREAKGYNGVLSIGDLNLSAVRSRSERARLISGRSGAEHLDWYGYLEELCIRVMETERRGKPAVVLTEVDAQEEKIESWDIEGFPVLTELPMVLFGDAASGKSYFAMWVAGLLAQILAQQGAGVLYADWELSQFEHRKRLGRLFQPMPKNIHYVRCEYPLSQQTDRVLRLIQEHRIKYVILDSIGFAVDGGAETQEAALKYFRAVRQIGVGTLNLAHIPKQYDDSREAQIYGSTFFKAGARSAWFVDKATVNPRNEIRFGLHHRKSNVGPLLGSQGYRLVFDGKLARVESMDIKSVDELTTQLPILDRVKMLLTNGAQTLKAIADELGVPAGSVRNVLSRHKGSFVKMGNKYGLLAEGVDF